MKKRKTTKVLAMLMSAVLLICMSTAKSFAVKPETKLQFNDNGTFKIMHICDIQDDSVLKRIVKIFLNDAIESEKPDLIILGGDNISGGGCGTRLLGRAAINNYMSIFDSFGVPVLVCFGNHDEEGALSKEEMLAIYCEYDCFIGYDDGEELYGCANNSVQIYDRAGESIAYNIYAVDSNDYNDDEGEDGYGYVHHDQVEWYRAQRDSLYEATGDYVPSMAFQHIIVPQIYELLTEVPYETAVSRWGKYYISTDAVAGELNEGPCPPNLTAAQGFEELEAMMEKGDVKAMFFGHDHVNNFVADYYGIDLVNTPGVGFNSYGGDNRGLRIITLNDSDLSTYETYTIKYLDYYAQDEAMLELFKTSGSEFTVWERIVAFFNYIWASFVALFK